MTLGRRLSLGVLFSRIFVRNFRILFLLVDFMDSTWLPGLWAIERLVSFLATVVASDYGWT
jgi:hypothetical protein